MPRASLTKTTPSTVNSVPAEGGTAARLSVDEVASGVALASAAVGFGFGLLSTSDLFRKPPAGMGTFAAGIGAGVAGAAGGVGATAVAPGGCLPGATQDALRCVWIGAPRPRPRPRYPPRAYGGPPRLAPSVLAWLIDSGVGAESAVCCHLRGRVRT